MQKIKTKKNKQAQKQKPSKRGIAEAWWGDEVNWEIG